MPKIVCQEDIIKRIRVVHGDLYDLSRVVYVSSKTPITLVCQTHGEFSILLGNVTANKSGCPKCAGKGFSKEEWVDRFVSVHGDRYGYSRAVYTTSKDKIEIVCKEHGSFWQTPENHYRGVQRCPHCKGSRIQKSKQLSFEAFVSRANQKHDSRFSYIPIDWTNLNTGVVGVVCAHGVYKQSPVNHLAGKVPCPKCSDKKSAPENEVADFLKIFTPVIQRDKTIIKPKELDIVLPEYKLAVEFCGMYWHSHGDVASENKDKHRHWEKYKSCLATGYRLITLFESDWTNRKLQVKRLLRNCIGKSKGKLQARKCKVQRVEGSVAAEFFDKYHIQGGSGHGEHYGLFWKDKLVACMRFTFGANDRGAGASRMWTLTRYATRVTVAGGASRLFSAFTKEQNPAEVKSFSNNCYFSGAMYEQLGFSLVEESPPDYKVWSQTIGLRPKSHYQRRCITARLKDHGIQDEYNPEADSRTEREMTYHMGARRIYDCGKKKWLWTNPA